MKKLVSIATVMLASLSLTPAALAIGVANDAKAPHVKGGVANPNSSRHEPVHYYFKLHVAGKPLSQLSIDAPEELRLSEQIEVTDSTGKKLDANVSLNGQRAIVAFAQPIPPDAVLKVDMRGIKKTAIQPDDGQIWNFLVSSKLVGLNGDIPLGVARIQTRLRS